jgi:hypothetical protein
MCELRFAENTLGGAGVPLRVLLSAYPASTMTWYSSTWGGEEDENVFVVGMVNASSRGKKYNGPVNRSSSPMSVEEFDLASIDIGELGIHRTKDSFDVVPESRVDAAFWIHDDCFFAARVTSDAVLTHFIESILSMHSYYVSEEVDWGQVPGIVANILKCGKTTRLKGNRLQKHFSVAQEAEGFRWQFWKTAYTQRLSCDLAYGKAVVCSTSDHLS